MNHKIRSDLIPPELEAVCLEIIKPQSKPFIVTTIYRPPNANAEFFDHLEKLIKQIDDENKEMYILGDLNCNLLGKKTLFNMQTNKLNSLCELYQLSQLINEPTRVTMTTSSLIDHVVTNTPEKISHSGVVHTGISDHSLVYAIRKIRVFQKSLSNMRVASLRVASLRVASLRVASLRVASLRVASLRVASLRVASLRVASLRVASLRVASLRVASLRVASLRVASLRVASLRVASLRVASLRVASLRVASLRVCELRVCELRVCESASCESASCESASCESASCESASCESASCESASCESASFESASCESASCESASCESAASCEFTVGIYCLENAHLS